VIFVCENNGYAVSVPQRLQMPIQDVADRAAGYGMPGVVVDGADVLAVYEAAAAAVERARRGDGPTLIEAKVERLWPHTSNDDDTRYRTRDELEAIKQRDPVPLFKQQLLSEQVLSDDLVQQIEAEITREVNDAQHAAESASDPTGSDVLKHIYAE
jgi:2-oxoisovalerate dehydrogenase E1 component alpha subunit